MINVSKEFLTLWAAGLSTLLALIKIWETWSARQRIDISYNFVGLPEQGNDIIIRNLSSKPIIITYWELLFCKRKGFRWVPYRNINPEEDIYDICIQGHSSKILNFRDQNYFDWGHNALKGNRIYLKMFIAGNKLPFKKKIYN